MASKDKKRKKQSNNTHWFLRLTEVNSSGLGRELCAISFFLFAFFVFMCNQYPNTTGILGNWIHYISARLFGIQGASYLPIFLAIPAFSLVATNIRQKIILAAISTSYICFVILLESIHYLSNPAPLWRLESQVGGVIGVAGQFILNKFIGTNGTLIFITGIFSVSTLLVFGLSIRNLLVQLIQLIDASNKNRPAKVKKTTKKNHWITHCVHLLFFRKVRVSPPKKIISKLPQPSKKPATPPTTSLPEDPPSPEPSSSDPLFEIPNFSQSSPPQETPIEEPSISISVKQTPPVESLPNVPSQFQLPPQTLLKAGKKITTDSAALTQQKKAQAQLLETTLHSFNVNAQVVNITTGPSVTRFELQPGEGVKISKITNLSKDIALKLAAPDIRIEAPIPGKALVGIEVPNQSVDMVTLRTIMDQTQFYDQTAKLLTIIGMSITGEAILMDLAKLPHILIAGATGSGKSVCVNAIIISILMKASPDEVKFLMIDPKKVELSLYEGIPHLLAPVVTNPHKAAATLKKWALIEMENRYETFSRIGVKDIIGYNDHIEKELKTYHKRADTINAKEAPSKEDIAYLENKPTKLPYIVVIIDELADLMMVASQDVEQTICRLAQMARATGIHLVIATQRPSVNVITGLIKANIPSRISFFLQSQIDSRTILDIAGAEKLLGKGDMLYSPVGSFKPKRAQGVFVSEGEVKNIVEWLKSQGTPDYNDDILDVEPLNEETDNNSHDNDKDELYENAKELIMNTQYASTSYLQRKLRIGYNRAARIMDQLTEDGIVAQYANEKKPRSIPT